MFDAEILSISLKELIFSAISAAYLFTVFSIIWVVISENRSPVRSLAWITVLLMLPVFGIILYLFFGRSLKREIQWNQRLRRIKLQDAEDSEVDINSIKLNANSLQTAQLAQTLCQAYYHKGNKIDIYTDGATKFEALKADLLSGSSYINMQYYIFEDDEIGNEIKNILIRKVKEGVKVRVIYDDVGSFNVSKQFFKEMNDAGVEAFPFMRITFPQFAQRVNWRNHRKMLIIDGKYGYIGGMNIADRYIKGCTWGTKKVWRDTHLRITGPAVSTMQFSFALDWNFMRKGVLTDEAYKFTSEPGTAGIQTVTSGPMSQWNNIAIVMLHAISNAKKCIYLQTPYFLPTESLLKALQTAALSGVDVRIMIPKKSDSVLIRYSSFSYVSECLKAGIKFYFFEAGMLHAKMMVVDDELSTVGSTNFDFRSFEHNYEGNVFIYCKETNSRLKEIFIKDSLECSTCDYAQWMARPKSERMIESVIRLLSPVL